MAVRDRIVVADDDPVLRTLIERQLKVAGYETVPCASGTECLARLEDSIVSTVLLDLSMPGLSGHEVLERILLRNPRLPVVILTSDGSVASVVSAVKMGAFDYLVKPVDKARLLATVRNALERHAMTQRLGALEREVEPRGFRAILGDSTPMRELFRQMDRVAASDIAVLIEGESGTGKELVSRAIHEASSRSNGPLVALNCAAIPETLQESELFGHERGAFTGAVERRKGRIEQAHGGTLFLDEVGELSPALQAKLLRVLQERTFQRLGGTAELRSDFRLLSATHRDLEVEVRDGRFRQDLFFRLAVFDLSVPPLRDRGDDRLKLAEAFLARACEAAGRSRARFDEEARAALLAYEWPGNVRELENAVQRAFVVSDGSVVRREDLPERVLAPAPVPASAPAAAAVAPPTPDAAPATVESVPPLTLAELEQLAIRAALEACDGNQAAAARRLGIDRSTLYRKLRALEPAIEPGGETLRRL